jgi:DNA-binding transcriptional ArsR family regulator
MRMGAVYYELAEFRKISQSTTVPRRTLSALSDVVDDLAARVAALEASPRRASRALTSLDELPEGEDGGAVRYTGAVSVGDRVVAWDMNRRWDDLARIDPAIVAPVLAALGSAQRVQILQLLLWRPATTAELTAAVEGRSSGQLFHHLKELLAAGVIHQPARGTYAIGEAHVIPLLTLLSAALDVRGSAGLEDS